MIPKVYCDFHDLVVGMQFGSAVRPGIAEKNGAARPAQNIIDLGEIREALLRSFVFDSPSSGGDVATGVTKGGVCSKQTV